MELRYFKKQWNLIFTKETEKHFKLKEGDSVIFYTKSNLVFLQINDNFITTSAKNIIRFIYKDKGLILSSYENWFITNKFPIEDAISAVATLFKLKPRRNSFPITLIRQAKEDKKIIFKLVLGERREEVKEEVKDKSQEMLNYFSDLTKKKGNVTYAQVIFPLVNKREDKFEAKVTSGEAIGILISAHEPLANHLNERIKQLLSEYTEISEHTNGLIKENRDRAKGTTSSDSK